MDRFKTAVFVVIGMFIGLWAGEASEEMLGLIAGGVIGLLLARIARLEHKVREQRLQRPVRRPGSSEPTPDILHRPGDRNWMIEGHATEEPAPTELPRTLKEGVETGATARPERDAWTAKETVPTSLEPSLLSRGLEYAKNWITQGNVPVKVGVIISFIGFSFLLKYAIDKELIFLPLELRLVGVGLFGLGLLVLGWRLRERTRTYAISLQGGGLGIMFLTVFSAYRIWSLISPGWAFTLLALLAFATGALALIQNARTLAILGTVGGFLAPLLASTGQGSHVALFSYYLAINGAIFGLAWFRAWRGLNLIGWLFTFVIGCYWGYQYYRPVHFSSVEPFLILYFLMYNAIAILFALRQKAERIGMVDGTLVFGTPVVIFAVQAALLEDSEYGLAWSAVVLAAFYAMTAWALLRRKGETLALLIESYKALAVVFVTLAIPLALDARWTAGAWALEGAALVWIGMRQSHHLAALAGSLLVFGAGLAFMDDGWRSGRGLAVLNGNVLGGMLVSLSALFSGWQLRQPEITRRLTDGPYRNAYWLASLLLLLWGVAWWTGIGLLESLDRVEGDGKLHVFLLFMAGSTLLALRLEKTLEWAYLRRVGLLLGVVMILVALWDIIEKQHFVFALGGLAWPIAWFVQGRVLWNLDHEDERDWGTWHLASVLLITALLAIETFWQVDQRLSETWSFAFAVSIAGLTPWLVHRLVRQAVWPATSQARIYLYAGVLVTALQVAYLTLLSIDKPGDPDPLFYLPVFNPFDLALLAVGGSALVSLRLLRANAEPGEGVTLYRWFLGLAFFVLTTTALVRGVYHVGGGSWRFESLFESVLVQTSLSIYWAILGFGGMIWGAKKGRRPVWLVGAAFMLLVVLKLFAVDLTQTGTIERIISFIGVGILLLVVGYFAPAPPRIKSEE